MSLLNLVYLGSAGGVVVGDIEGAIMESDARYLDEWSARDDGPGCTTGGGQLPQRIGALVGNENGIVAEGDIGASRLPPAQPSRAGPRLGGTPTYPFSISGSCGDVELTPNGGSSFGV